MPYLIRRRLFGKLLLLFLILIPGCLEAQPSTFLSPRGPVAYIDSVSASNVYESQTVSFSGHGSDLGGTIVAYLWQSSIDGILNASASFNTSRLSTGYHSIFFKVQNNQGEWSREAVVQLNVFPVRTAKPNIYFFKADPILIELGDYAKLEWNVSGAFTVSILPDIGNVPPIGTRIISPFYTKEYTLTATNISGSVNQTVDLIVGPKESKIVELFSIPEEEGFVSRFGDVGNIPTAGITGSGVPFQAFFSFDISSIPAGARITSAYIDLSDYTMYGYPSVTLGQFGVFEDQYGSLRSEDFAVAFTLDGLVLLDKPPTEPFASAALLTALQKQVDQGKTRFQARAQFAKFDYFIYHQGENYLEFEKGKSRLIVKYR